MHHRVYPLIVHIKGRGKRRGLEPLFLPAVQRMDFARVAAGAYIPPGAKGTSQSRRWQNTTQDAKGLDLSASTPYVRDKSHRVKAFFWSKAVFLDDPEKRQASRPSALTLTCIPQRPHQIAPTTPPLTLPSFSNQHRQHLALKCQRPGQGGSLSLAVKKAPHFNVPRAPPR